MPPVEAKCERDGGAMNGNSVAGLRNNKRALGRDVRRAETVMCLFAVLLVVASVVFSASHTPSHVATRTVRIDAGDTLWSIAQAHPVKGLSTAETVELITRINGLPSAKLRTGGEVMVPVNESGSALLAMR